MRANTYRQSDDDISIDSDSEVTDEKSKEYSLNTNLSDTGGGQLASTEAPPTNQATPGQAGSHTQASSGSSAKRAIMLGK